MTPSNGKQHGTLYEQVLDFARREIEDASSKIDELRRSLHLLEARVEAAKSVYESVAARLNLEDELENEEIQLDAPAYAAPPQQPPEPPEERSALSAPESSPESSAPPAPAPAPVPPQQQAPHQQPRAQAPPPSQASEPAASEHGTSGGNGASDGFSMDLIRRHLEARDKAAQEAAAEAPRRSGTASAPPAESNPAPQMSEPASQPEAPPEQPESQSGFPGLSEADRALIAEYLRSKRGK